MKNWQILLLAIFFVLFLMLGKIFNPETGTSPLEMEEVSQETEPSSPVSNSGAQSIETEMSGEEKVLLELLPKIQKADESNVQNLFKEVESIMQQSSNPSILLVNILNLENSQNPNSYTNLVKGYALDHFFHRLQEKSDFIPGPPVKESLVRLLATENSMDLALEAGQRLLRHFGYDRDKVVEVIDERPDRDQFLKSLFVSESH